MPGRDGLEVVSAKLLLIRLTSKVTAGRLGIIDRKSGVSMNLSIMGHRLLTLIVVVSFSSSLWANCCTEPRDASPDFQNSSNQNRSNDCPPMPTLECCATIQPFVTVENAVAPAPESAAVQLAVPELTVSGTYGPYSASPFEVLSPPGIVPSEYLATSVLRI